MPNLCTQQTHTVWRLLLALMLLPAVNVAAELPQGIPPNALGFAVISNLSETSHKVEKLLEPFEVTFPAPLTFAKLLTGLDTGLDTSGDLVIALLPSENPKAGPTPMVLLPIADYRAFAESISADTSGEICRATLLGEDILIAKAGTHALWMNVEHRATMEKLLARFTRQTNRLQPLASWLPKQDIALVLMPAGIEQLSALARRQSIGLIGDYSDRHSMLGRLRSLLFRTEILQWLDTNVELAAVGLSVDDQANVRLGEQFFLRNSSPLASLTPDTFKQQTAKLGLSNKPNVFAAGGPVAPGWGKQLATYVRQLEQENASRNGMEEITSGLWDKEQRAYELLFEDILACSAVMLTGEKGEPLVGNFLGIATVPDVSNYFDSLPQVIETWNKLTQRSTSDLKPNFQLNRETVAGKQHREIIIDIATTARDPNVPIINWMLEAALGPKGKMRIKFAEINATTFAFGLATPEQMTELLKRVNEKATNKPQGTQSQVTLGLLKPTAPWKALISPQGCLRWTSRVYSEFWGLLNNEEINIPVMPDASPFGLTLDADGRHWECELVCPAVTWEALGKYVQEAKDL